MSLINKMLQDLDRRHAAPGPANPVSDHVRPAALRRTGSQMFWWVMAGLMLLAVAWIGWVMWQLTPRPVVNEVALLSVPRPAAALLSATPSSVSGAAGEGQPAMDAGSSPTGGDQAAAALAASRPEMLRMATEITTPLAARAAKPVRPQSDAVAAGRSSAAVPAPVSARPVPYPEPVPALPPQSAAVVSPAAPPTPPAAISELMVPRTPAPAAIDLDSGKIDKKVSGTSRDRAEAEYRRALVLVNQRRMSDGLDALRGALLLDPGYEAARQMLVALYMEQRRAEDAMVVLHQGLEVNPANNAFAMLLARLMVDRRDVAGALDVLRKYAPAAGRNAEYHAFTAALYQRLSRHDDAISEYRVALQLVPNAASWWAGLAISLEASDRRMEAANSYRRARETGANGELLAYIEQRLKVLQ